MRIVKIIAFILLVGLVVIQFFSTDRNESNNTPGTDFMLVNDVPNTINKKLEVSCYDCHSNNTRYPWYNKVQPVAWLLENHIKDAKAELNFNEWDSLSNRRKKSKLKSIISQIKDGEMPLSSYSLIHRNAIFSEIEKQETIQWLTQLRDSINNNN